MQTPTDHNIDVRSASASAGEVLSIENYHNVAAKAAAAAAAYYDTDTVIVDDATYDRWVAQLAATEAAHPDLGQSDITAAASRTGHHDQQPRSH